MCYKYQYGKMLCYVYLKSAGCHLLTMYEFIIQGLSVDWQCLFHDQSVLQQDAKPKSVSPYMTEKASIKCQFFNL